MKLRAFYTIALLIVVLSLVVSIWAYYNIPTERVASHWNAQGEVDGYMNKFWGLFLFPIIAIFLYLMFLAIPHIDPLKKNIKKFQCYYELFVFVFLSFFFYVQCLMVVWNLGFTYNMNLALMPALSVMFYFLGILLSKTKRNWFIGIRTPWTLSSEKVWRKTHDAGGRWFKALAVYFLLLLLFENFLERNFVWLILIPILCAAFGLIAYSYWLYSKEEGRSK